MLPWQDDFLRKNVKSWTYGHLYKELYIPRDAKSLLHILATWPQIECLGYEDEVDTGCQHVRCACGRTLNHHDCYCWDCGLVMKATVVKHPEFGYADEIFTCLRCGNRGANRSFIQFPK